MQSEWKEVIIDELFTVQNGYAFKSSDYVEENDKCFEVLKMGHIERGGGLRKDPKKSYIPRSEYLERWVLDKNDIVMAMTDMKDNVVILGVPAMIDKDNHYVLNQRVARLNLKRKDIADIYFLYNYLKWKEFLFELQSKANSGVQVNLSTTAIKESMILLPPLPEQKAIASVLSSLDDKIDLLHRQNKTLEAMAETLFRQWFVEEAQEYWEDVKIKDFDAIVTDYVANGSFASLAENVQYKSEPDFAVLVRLTDYNNGFNGDFVYIDEHAYNFLEKSKLFGGEVIISNVGAYSGTVFRCPKLKIPMTLGPNSIVIKSKYNGFFYTFFRSSYGQYLLDGIISGSAQPKFNKTAFRNTSLHFPSIQYIIDFEILIKPYFVKIDLNYAQIHTLEKLRDTLLPKLMSGEVRVEYNEN